MNTTVVEIVRGYSTKIKDGKVLFAPAIPSRKLRNALNTFAPGVAEQDVLVLVDNTLFGSAKEGGLLTETTLYVRRMMQRPESIALADIHGVTLHEEGSTPGE